MEFLNKDLYGEVHFCPGQAFFGEKRRGVLEKPGNKQGS
jgi:hypothetical protein